MGENKKRKKGLLANAFEKLFAIGQKLFAVPKKFG